MLRVMRMNGSLSMVEGISLSELQKETSTAFVNSLRANGLIYITKHKEVYLTDQGRIARKIGLENFLRLELSERKLLATKMKNLRIEKRGLNFILLGLLFSLLFIISFWTFHWEF